METTITISNRITILELEIEQLEEDIKIVESVIGSRQKFGDSVILTPYKKDTDLITRRYLHKKAIEIKLSTIKNLKELSEDLSTPLIIYVWKL
jgi:hypothetical protein